MGEVEYPNSRTYPAKEHCISSVTFKESLWKIIVVKSSPLVISTTESRLSTSFSN
ncbi:hypothetical protein B296_00053766 [Ensete ventricosum]|uniref:Uncharacterized protein n=1 Tax=Ensete ventricosum TaxID=4639 RepID=A0A426WYB5_ENSVE|nr:hypothetical protein B296_00053766 [Ensete ventricosum]